MEKYIEEYVDESVVRFLYQLLIMGSGFILLYILSKQGFPVQNTILIMLIWFFLIIIFPTPKNASEDLDPFGDMEIPLK